jgi:2-polyprenyl-6-methoxyphenol hydroxylase-like FAD-dependent oxidoreductase
MLAADGAHSTVRESLGIPFSGSTLAHVWRLADVHIETGLPEDRAHVFLLSTGFLFALRVVSGEPASAEEPLWRVITDAGDPVESIRELGIGRLPQAPVWHSEFHIAHRIVDRMSVGPFHLAGDAAHVHSPIGARGMNLGIEDAWAFAELASRDELHRYGGLRHAVDEAVVRRIGLITRFVSSEARWRRAVRQLAVRMLPRVGFARRQMLRMVTGLDHPLTVGA